MENEIRQLVELARSQVEISKVILEQMRDMGKTMREIRIRLVDKLPD